MTKIQVGYEFVMGNLNSGNVVYGPAIHIKASNGVHKINTTPVRNPNPVGTRQWASYDHEGKCICKGPEC